MIRLYVVASGTLKIQTGLEATGGINMRINLIETQDLINEINKGLNRKGREKARPWLWAYTIMVIIGTITTIGTMFTVRDLGGYQRALIESPFVAVISVFGFLLLFCSIFCLSKFHIEWCKGDPK